MSYHHRGGQITKQTGAHAGHYTLRQLHRQDGTSLAARRAEYDDDEDWDDGPVRLRLPVCYNDSAMPPMSHLNPLCSPWHILHAGSGHCAGDPRGCAGCSGQHHRLRGAQYASQRIAWRGGRRTIFVPSWRTLLLHCCWPGIGSLLYRLLVQVDISVKAGLALVVLGFARSLLGVSAAVMSLRNP